MPEASGLACRVCIAQHGLTARSYDRLFETRDAFDAHFSEQHPDEP